MAQRLLVRSDLAGTYIKPFGDEYSVLMYRIKCEDCGEIYETHVYDKNVYHRCDKCKAIESVRCKKAREDSLKERNERYVSKLMKEFYSGLLADFEEDNALSGTMKEISISKITKYIKEFKERKDVGK